MKMFVVMADTGEHSDKIEWVVCAHRTHEGAVIKRTILDTWAKLYSVDREHYFGDHKNIPRERCLEAYNAWHAQWPEYSLSTPDYNGLAFEVVSLEYDPDEQIPGDGVV